MDNARTFKLMEDAGKYAAGFSEKWRFKDEDEIYDSSFMIFSLAKMMLLKGWIRMMMTVIILYLQKG